VFAGLIELRVGTAGSQISGHGRRVAEQARSVGQRLGLPDTEVQNIMLAGLLHDIGKIGLPDDLLTKPFNALTPEQRALVVKHPVIGQNILMGIEKFKDAAIIVRHHHECFDGSGYPDRLAGNAFPQGGRILQVVNDYDSLLIGTLVQRPLKPAEAQKFIIENRGKRYDPAVVDAFIALLTETGKPVITEVPYRPLLLKPGMVLSRDFLHRDGYLLLAKGAVLTAEVIAQLVRMEDAEQLKLMLHVRQEEK
jgi:response regulator RpfG family c-di-GMP phosphodiesterase